MGPSRLPVNGPSIQSCKRLINCQLCSFAVSQLNIHRVKVEAAKRSLESQRKNVNEIMYEVGYQDAKAFRNVFKKITGLTPASYRAQYHT